MGNKLAVFEKKEIRKTIHNNEWWFVIEDFVLVLTNSINPKGYIKDMRRRDSELSKGWGQIATPLSIDTAGGKQKIEYGILTAEISKATFGMTPSEYKKYKGLKREDLRDHYTDLELIFSMLGEAATTEIICNKDTQGFNENLDAASKGGKIAGDARKNLETESGQKVSTDTNYLTEPEKVKRIK